VVFEADRANARQGLFLYRLDDRRFVEGGSLSDGGNLHVWLERTLRLGEQPAFGPPDGHGLTFLPLLGGERSPGWNGRARGAIAGLSFDTTADELLQAAHEGVALRFAEIAELVGPVEEVVATGTALRQNPAWAQIVADALGRPLTLSPVEEASARGAAVVVLERLGARPGEPPPGEVVQPRPEAVEAYRAARERQRELYEHLT
jgi:gluconokinase